MGSVRSSPLLGVYFLYIALKAFLILDFRRSAVAPIIRILF